MREESTIKQPSDFIQYSKIPAETEFNYNKHCLKKCQVRFLKISDTSLRGVRMLSGLGMKAGIRKEAGLPLQSRYEAGAS